MTRLEAKLEPDEFVLHNSSSWRALWPVLLWLTFVSLALAISIILPLWAAIPEHPVAAAFGIGIGFLPAAVALVIAAPFTGFGEACIVTDRRFLFKTGLFRQRLSEMALSDIERADFHGAILRLTGPGRSLDIPAARNGLTAPILVQILPNLVPVAGKPVAGIGRILEPGARVIFRYPSPWFERVLRTCFLGIAGCFAWLAYGDLVDQDWSGAWGAAFFMFIMISAVFSAPAGRHGWSYLVTNRRLLRNFDWDASRYEEIPLAEIEADWRSQFADRLAARHKGRDLDIPAKGKDAERVLAAIQAARGEA